LASEIYLFDPVDRRPRRIAASHAPPSPDQTHFEDRSPPTIGPQPVLEWPNTGSFVRGVLKSPALHRKLVQLPDDVPDASRDGHDAPSVHLLGARIEAGNEIRGLMLFEIGRAHV